MKSSKGKNRSKKILEKKKEKQKMRSKKEKQDDWAINAKKLNKLIKKLMYKRKKRKNCKIDKMKKIYLL